MGFKLSVCLLIWLKKINEYQDDLQMNALLAYHTSRDFLAYAICMPSPQVDLIYL